MAPNIPRLRECAQSMTALVESSGNDEPELLKRGAAILGELVREDDWLPEEFAKPHADHYQQYLLYCDPRQRFSIVSFVWGPGQRTPIHDHTVWGLIGVLRGSETCRTYSLPGAGAPLDIVKEYSLGAGCVDAVSPRIGDIHEVSNTFSDRISISIHIYGADISQVTRSVFGREDGSRKPFRSGYANAAHLDTY